MPSGGLRAGSQALRRIIAVLVRQARPVPLLLLADKSGQPLRVLIQIDPRGLVIVADGALLTPPLRRDRDRWLRIVVRRPWPIRPVQPDPHQPLDPDNPTYGSQPRIPA